MKHPPYFQYPLKLTTLHLWLRLFRNICLIFSFFCATLADGIAPVILRHETRSCRSRHCQCLKSRTESSTRQFAHHRCRRWVKWGRANRRRRRRRRGGRVRWRCLWSVGTVPLLKVRCINRRSSVLVLQGGTEKWTPENANFGVRVMLRRNFQVGRTWFFANVSFSFKSCCHWMLNEHVLVSCFDTVMQMDRYLLSAQRRKCAIGSAIKWIIRFPAFSRQTLPYSTKPRTLHFSTNTSDLPILHFSKFQHAY